MPKRDDLALAELIDVVLEAGVDASRWSDVPGLLIERFQGTAALIQGADSRSAKCIGVVQKGMRPDLANQYSEYFSKINPWAPHWASKPTLSAFASDHEMPAARFDRTEFYNDFLKVHGEIDSAAGIKIVADADRFAWLSVHYGANLADDYNELFPHILEKVAPAMRAALELQRLIQTRSEASPTIDALLDLIGQASFVVDGRARIVRAAEEKAAHGEMYRNSGGCLRLRDPKADAALRAALDATCARCEPRDFCIPLRDPDGALVGTVSVFPLPLGFADDLAWLFGSTRRALVILRTLQPPVGRLNRLLPEFFGLTAAETRVATRLFAGDSPREISEALGLTTGTVREYLKRLFEKTGTHRQAELVALIARVAAGTT
jgi:DNA-binding CsgD family transcriptional regulator